MKEKRWRRFVNGLQSTSPTPPHRSIARGFLIIHSTVIDIWALQSQPNFQPRATLPSTGSPGSSRVPSNEIRSPILDGGNDEHDDDTEIRQEAVSTTISSRPSSSNIGQKHLAPVPNNWGEVVISPRRKKGNNNKAGVVNGASDGDIFGVLRVN